MEDMDDSIIELIDEDGESVQFYHLCTIAYEDDEYVILSEVDAETDDDEEQEVLIMRIEPGEEEDEYVGVEDEDVLNKVFAMFLDILNDDEEDE